MRVRCCIRPQFAIVGVWLVVPAMTGYESNLLEWLWAPLNGHRLPLQKAIALILLKISGGDFRIGRISNAITLGGLSLAMILTAAHLRGQTRLADAFFPLALLHLGNLVNFLFFFQIQHVFSTVLYCIWLLIIVREPWPLTPKVAITTGLLLVLLPIASANAFILMPFVVFWLAAGALLYQRATSSKWIVPFHCACIIISIALACFYLVGLKEEPAYAGIAPTLVYALRFVGTGIGQIGAAKASAQLVPGVVPKLITGFLFFGAVVSLIGSSIIPLRRGLSRIRAPEGSRSLGLLMFIAAMAALALVVAWGRAGWIKLEGFPDRYALLSVPALCAAYFMWLLYGPETTRNRITNAFATVALLAFPFNVKEGLVFRDYYVTNMQAFEQNVADGLSWQELADKHKQFLLPMDPDALIERMQMLHEANIGPLGTATPR